MQLVIPEHRLVFFAIPKAANSSIKVAIRTSLGQSTHPDKIHKGWQEATPSEISEQYGKYRKVAFVRNPFDRLVSCWWQKLHRGGTSGLVRMGFRPGMPFGEFIKKAASIGDKTAEHHFKSQTWGMTHEGEMLPEFIGRFESLTDDWERMRFEMNLDLPGLEHRNPSDHNHYREYYTPELISVVRKRWAKDLELLGYDF